jgi:hypothetical protein
MDGMALNQWTPDHGDPYTAYRRGWRATNSGEVKPADKDGREIHLQVSPRLIVKGSWFDDTEIPISPPANLTFREKIDWLKHYAQYLIDEPEILHDVIRFSPPEYSRVEFQW